MVLTELFKQYSDAGALYLAQYGIQTCIETRDADLRSARSKDARTCAFQPKPVSLVVSPMLRAHPSLCHVLFCAFAVVSRAGVAN